MSSQSCTVVSQFAGFLQVDLLTVVCTGIAAADCLHSCTLYARSSCLMQTCLLCTRKLHSRSLLHFGEGSITTVGKDLSSMSTCELSRANITDSRPVIPISLVPGEVPPSATAAASDLRVAVVVRTNDILSLRKRRVDQTVANVSGRICISALSAQASPHCRIRPSLVGNGGSLFSMNENTGSGCLVANLSEVCNAIERVKKEKIKPCEA